MPVSDKVLRDKTFNYSKNPNYDGYQRGLISMVYSYFDKKNATGTGIGIASDAVSKNQQLAKDHTSQLLESLKNVEYIYLLKITFGVQT